MNIVFFKTPKELRNWFKKNHLKERELLVGYYKKETGKPSITWPESVEEALCFGWIDGIRRKKDEESYFIRFTPRKPKSNWSAVNLKLVEKLISNNLMQANGLAAYYNRPTNNVGEYSSENPPIKLSPQHELQFKKDPIAWDFFCQQAPFYKKQMFMWVESAKQALTRERRLEKLIQASKNGQRLL